MIHDELVTYEVAKLAKEKGFNVPTDFCYEQHGCLVRCGSIAAPTQSLLQRWLREEKFIDFEIYPIFINGVKVYTCRAYAPNLNKPKKFNYFDTYELALEDALKYTLENLI